MKNIMISLLVAMSTVACASGDNSEILTISEENSIVLNMPITMQTASEVNRKLLDKNDKLPKGKPIYLVLDTPGGSIDDGMKIIEVAKSLPRPVHTVSLFNASMGFIIAQHLDTRYVLLSSVMMSHRASVNGVKGEYPGSFISRFLAIGNQLMTINSRVAERAGLPLMRYLDLTANELWMGPEESIKLKFADKKVILRCDKSLKGYNEAQEIDLGIFSVKVKFHKCPLIAAPVIEKGDSSLINMMVNDKLTFMSRYGNLLK